MTEATLVERLEGPGMKIIGCGCPVERGHLDRCPTLTALAWPDGTPKVAPVQKFVQGIPWSIHLEAYNAYCAKWGGQAALIDLDRRGCRGGFGTEELDKLLPGWRERVSERAALLARITHLEARERELVEALGNVIPMANAWWKRIGSDQLCPEADEAKLLAAIRTLSAKTDEETPDA